MKYINLPRESREKLMAGLEQMPAFVAAAFADLPPSRHAEPGRDGTFSPVEQAWHLADLEDMGFTERIRRLRTESHPHLPDFAGDVVARERDYKALSLSEGIAAFRRARARNLSALRSLTREEWTRRGEQEGVGAVALCDLPTMMAAHDEGHRREIEAWLAQTVESRSDAERRS